MSLFQLCCKSSVQFSHSRLHLLAVLASNCILSEWLTRLPLEGNAYSANQRSPALCARLKAKPLPTFSEEYALTSSQKHVYVVGCSCYSLCLMLQGDLMNNLMSFISYGRKKYLMDNLFFVRMINYFMPCVILLQLRLELENIVLHKLFYSRTQFHMFLQKPDASAKKVSYTLF